MKGAKKYILKSTSKSNTRVILSRSDREELKNLYSAHQSEKRSFLSDAVGSILDIAGVSYEEGSCTCKGYIRSTNKYLSLRNRGTWKATRRGRIVRVTDDVALGSDWRQVGDDIRSGIMVFETQKKSNRVKAS